MPPNLLPEPAPGALRALEPSSAARERIGPSMPLPPAEPLVRNPSGGSSSCGTAPLALDPRPTPSTDVASEARLAPFLTKLFNLVDSAETDETIRWAADGGSIVIVDPSRLSREVLPRFFRHNKLGTFTQLYTYGFQREHVGEDFFAASHLHARAL